MTRKRPDVQLCGERHESYLHCLTCNPPPAENPARLQGPEVGTLCRYAYRDNPPIIVQVIERSYVWAPGDPAYHGGSRRYDWKIIARGPNGTKRLCVDDKDLVPLQPGDSL